MEHNSLRQYFFFFRFQRHPIQKLEFFKVIPTQQHQETSTYHDHSKKISPISFPKPSRFANKMPLSKLAYETAPNQKAPRPTNLFREVKQIWKTQL